MGNQHLITGHSPQHRVRLSVCILLPCCGSEWKYSLVTGTFLRAMSLPPGWGCQDCFLAMWPVAIFVWQAGCTGRQNTVWQAWTIRLGLQIRLRGVACSSGLTLYLLIGWHWPFPAMKVLWAFNGISGLTWSRKELINSHGTWRKNLFKRQAIVMGPKVKEPINVCHYQFLWTKWSLEYLLTNFTTNLFVMRSYLGISQ